MNSSRKKWLVGWLLLGALMVFAMVVVGGITRLTNSGLSMVDWHLIVGAVPPTTDVEWQTTFEDYQSSPEFKELNSDYSLEDFKSIFWWEFIHRLLGRVLGVVFLIPFIFFLIKGWLSKKLTLQLLLVFGLGAFQAFLGWFMVKSGLVNEPRVSHYRLAAHIVTAFITCMVIFWICLSLWKDVGEKIKMNSFGKLVVWFIVVVLIQIVYGAFVAGTHAGSVHNTWPLMDGQLIADSVWAIDPVYLNFLEGKSGIQFIHRTLGIAVLIMAGVIYYQGIKQSFLKEQIQAIRWVLICVLFQVVLGIFTLLFHVPIVLGILHQAGALIVLAVCVYLMHTTIYPAIPKSQ